MKKLLSLLSVALVFSLFLLAVLPTVKAAYINEQTISGNLSVTVHFKPEHADGVKEWLRLVVENAKHQVQSKIEKADTTERDQLQAFLNNLNNFQIEKVLTSRPDGSVDLHVPLPSVKVKIGNLETQADERGNYVLTGVPLGTNKIQLIKEDHVFYEKTIVIDQNQDSLNVEIEKNEAEFFQGFTNMQQQMMSQQGSVSVQAALPAQQRFYPEQPVPSYPGIGRGEMKIFDANNLVSCNKADKGIEDLDGYGDTADFPLNFSDCSISIGYGVMFAYNPVMYAPFYRSYNCFIESIQNGMDNSEQNVYCNMKRKLAFPELEYHYNCSWFFGIEHSESMHAHQ